VRFESRTAPVISPFQGVNTFLAMSWKWLVEYSRYPVAFAALFAQILLITLIFLLAAVSFSPPNEDPQRSREVAGMMFYGFVVFMFMIFILQEMGVSLREEQLRGTLESLYLTPANKFSNLLSRIFAVSMWGGSVSLFGIAIVSLMVGGLPMQNLGPALFALLLTVSGLLGIAFMLSAITLKYKEGAQRVANFLFFFFMIFCATLYPFGVMPQILRDYVSRWLPPSYGVDLFRSLLIGRAPELASIGVEFVILFLFATLGPILGYALFRWAETSSRKEGTLSEY